MNNKGQMAGIGIVILVAIAAIVGAIFLTTASQQVGTTTSTITATNVSQTVTLGTAVNIPGKSWTGLVVYNVSGDLVPAANYTLANNQVVDGAETATLLASSDSTVYGTSWNLSGTYEPTTYISSAGGRSLANLVPIFFALAIAVTMLVPTLRSKLAEFMK